MLNDQTAPRRILLIEDSVDHLEAFTVLLRNHGFEVLPLARGDGALGHIQSFKPDLVVLDIGLPDVDGFTICEKIRSQPELDGLRVFALTGRAIPDLGKRTAKAGFDQYFLKPQGTEQIVALLTAS